MATMTDEVANFVNRFIFYLASQDEKVPYCLLTGWGLICVRRRANSLGWTSISDLGHPPPRSLSISQESTDRARVVHSLDSPVTLPVKSGLPVWF